MSIDNIQDISVGCIGTGTMGAALMQAIAAKNPKIKIFVNDVSREKATDFASKINAICAQDNSAVVKNSQFIFLAVKPSYIKDVIKEVRDEISPDKVLISIAAGVTLDTLYSALDDSDKRLSVIRVMPNLPATVGEAMIALSPAESVLESQTLIVKDLLTSAGLVEIVPEKLMDAVTAVSGSGPAYAFLFIEALADAAVRFGMPRKQAYIYAAQTLKGAASLALKDERSISELKDAVCSPAGTTIEGVIALEKTGFRSSVIEAATAAYNKSVELGKN